MTQPAFYENFDWTRAFALNTGALQAVIATMLRMLAAGEDKDGIFLFADTRRQLLRLLVPAEAAARRLIYLVMRVRDITASAPEQPGEKQKPVVSKKRRQERDEQQDENQDVAPIFHLIDPRKPLPAAFRKGPRRFRRMPRPRRADNDLPMPSEDLWRRTKALQSAISNLDKAAKRMAKLSARRLSAPPGPGCYLPLRQGRPPGWRRKPTHEVDTILHECQALAEDFRRAPP